jgi:hypothetical protein
VNGKQACESAAIYSNSTEGREESALKGMTMCHGPTRVSKGDLMSIEANFDLEKHPP